jgi:hypothetical protein
MIPKRQSTPTLPTVNANESMETKQPAAHICDLSQAVGEVMDLPFNRHERDRELSKLIRAVGKKGRQASKQKGKLDDTIRRSSPFPERLGPLTTRRCRHWAA